MSETTTDKTPTSWQDKTLKTAGYGYLVGDAAMAASGLIKGQAGKDIFRAGAIWAAGGVGAAVYGNPDIDKQLEILAHKLEAYLTKHGARVTDIERNNADLLRGKNTLGAKLDRFMHEHPTELLNGAYAIGASLLLKNGIADFASKKGKISAAMGGLVLAGALAGLLIKEDPDAMAKADPKSITSSTAAFIKEKPMRLASAFYWGGNIFTLANAFNDKKEFATAKRFGVKAHWMSFLTVAAYVAANGLLALSSRDQIEEKKFTGENVAQLEQVAAEIIAAQPPQLQAQLLTGVANYLASEKKIALTPEEITKQLIARVSETSKRHLAQGAENSWAGRTATQAAEAPSIS